MQSRQLRECVRLVGVPISFSIVQTFRTHLCLSSVNATCAQFKLQSFSMYTCCNWLIVLLFSSQSNHSIVVQISEFACGPTHAYSSMNESTFLALVSVTSVLCSCATFMAFCLFRLTFHLNKSGIRMFMRID